MPLALRIAALAAVLCLAACGGGGDTSAASDDTGGTSVTGVVAVGSPLEGATVESWCADGTAGPSATSTAGGLYTLQMPASCPGPWVLRATGSGKVLLSYGGSGADSFQVLNITSLTDLTVRLALELPDSEGIEDMILEKMKLLEKDWESRKQELAGLIAKVLDDAYPEVTLMEGFTELFEPRPGVTQDDILEALEKIRGEVTIGALIEQLHPQGGDLASGQPWKTLFGSAGALTLEGTSCSAGFNPVAPVTVTLRMQGEDLVVEGVSSDAAAPATFIIGRSVGSSFELTLRGADPYVELRLEVSGGFPGASFHLENAGAMQVFSFTGPGLSSRTCNVVQPLRRADLVAFQPAARIRSVIPATGTSGTCPATMTVPEFSYAISPMGDVRFNGTSLRSDWLDLPDAYYREALQFTSSGGMNYQLQLSGPEAGQGIQPYYYPPGYHVYCPNPTP